MKEIENRNDIGKLVGAFYTKIRANDLLGPIFNGHIKDEEWPVHISKLTDFWETNLLGVRLFKGRPGAKHIAVDRNLNHTISKQHFITWLQLWFETIDELYIGTLANRAKVAAQNMANGQLFAVLNNRPSETNS